MGSGGGGGSSPTKAIGNKLKDVVSGNILESALDIAVGGVTLGLAGYDKDKGITGGVSTEVLKQTGKAVSEPLKEITGAKAAEEATKLARQRLDDQKLRAAEARENARLQSFQDKLKASRAAQAARGGRTDSQSSVSKNSQYSSLGGQGDFLGL